MAIYEIEFNVKFGANIELESLKFEKSEFSRNPIPSGDGKQVITGKQDFDLASDSLFVYYRFSGIIGEAWSIEIKAKKRKWAEVNGEVVLIDDGETKDISKGTLDGVMGISIPFKVEELAI